MNLDNIDHHSFPSVILSFNVSDSTPVASYSDPIDMMDGQPYWEETLRSNRTRGLQYLGEPFSKREIAVFALSSCSYVPRAPPDVGCIGTYVQWIVMLVYADSLVVLGADHVNFDSITDQGQPYLADKDIGLVKQHNTSSSVLREESEPKR